MMLSNSLFHLVIVMASCLLGIQSIQVVQAPQSLAAEADADSALNLPSPPYKCRSEYLNPIHWQRGFTHRMQADRSGSALVGMLRHAIYAYRLGLTYVGAFRGEYPGQMPGGGCGPPSSLHSAGVFTPAYGGEYPGQGEIMHATGVNASQALAFPECDAWHFLGLPYEVTDAPKKNLYIANSTKELEKLVKEHPEQKASFLFNSGDKDGFGADIVHVVGQMTEEERAGIFRQVQLTTPSLWKSNARVKVAVHVRRGDLFICKHCTNLFQNQAYLRIIDKVRLYAPGAEFVVFSSTPFAEDREGFRESDWKGFSDLKLRIDGPIVEAWNHIMQADIFVHGDSSFSGLPLMLAGHEALLSVDIEISQAWTDSQWKARLDKFKADAEEEEK